MEFFLPSRFPSCLMAMQSTGGLLKSACKHFSVFQAVVGGTFGSAEGVSEMMS